jgi:hypothetical protein
MDSNRTHTDSKIVLQMHTRIYIAKGLYTSYKIGIHEIFAHSVDGCYAKILRNKAKFKKFVHFNITSGCRVFHHVHLGSYVHALSIHTTSISHCNTCIS